MNKRQVRNAGALVAVWVATALSWYWFWGAVMLGWAVASLRSGETYLTEQIRRAENPVLFYLAVATWAILGVLLGLAQFYPDASW